MWKALLAGTFALAFAGPTSAFADTVQSVGYVQSQGGGQVESGIARFKSALRLTPEQKKHWPRVEAALRALGRDSSRAEASEDPAQPGFFRRVGGRAADLAMSTASMQRLVSAAQPLVRSLDDDQKREAMSLARAMGFGSLAARFN